MHGSPFWEQQEKASTALLAGIIVYLISRLLKAIQEEPQAISYIALTNPVIAPASHDYNRQEQSDLALKNGDLVAITDIPKDISIRRSDKIGSLGIWQKEGWRRRILSFQLCEHPAIPSICLNKWY